MASSFCVDLFCVSFNLVNGIACYISLWIQVPPGKNNFKSKWYCSLYFSLLQLSGWCQPMWWMSFQHFWKYTAYITRNLWQMSVIFRRPTECHLAKKNRYIFWPSKKYTWKAKFFLFKTSLTLDTYGITKIACLNFW